MGETLAAYLHCLDGRIASTSACFTPPEMTEVQPGSSTTTARGRQSEELVFRGVCSVPLKFDTPQLHQPTAGAARRCLP
jgi:hypothetical protein